MQLFAVRRTELESLGKEPAVTLVRSVSWKSSVKSDLDQTGEEEVEENEEGQQREGEDNVSSENEEEESPPPSPTPQLLIDALTASLKKVRISLKMSCYFDSCLFTSDVLKFLYATAVYTQYCHFTYHIFSYPVE